MKSSLTLLVLILSTYNLIGQSPGYTIETFQEDYVELSSYQSLAIQTKGNLLWEFEFQLNFPFPFYDSTYTKVLFNHASWGSFTDDQDEALLLMDDLNTYTFDNVLDTSNIPSDVRFAHVTFDSLQAFVIQFTKVRFFADPFLDSLNTYLNYQIVLYENGVIDVCFGDMNIEDSPIYEAGEGFHCYTSNGVDGEEICGPHMGIANPLDEDDAIGLEGNIDDYEIVGDNYAVLTDVPPKGSVIRFKPVTVPVIEPKANELLICPNPTYSFINIGLDNCHVIIYDYSGKVIYNKTGINQKLDVSSLPRGMYSLQLVGENYTSVGRFIKL